MKVITILALLFLVSTAFGELTKEDIRIIIKEEIAASEKRTREYIDLKIDALDNKLSARIGAVENNLNVKIDAVNKSLGRVWLMIVALIGLITATIAIPQIIIAYRDRGQKEMERSQKEMQTQIDQLRKELEAMQQ